MKPTLGAKRRARKILVDEEDDEGATDPQSVVGSLKTHIGGPSPSSNLGRKAFKKSSLRQSIAFEDLSQDTTDTGTEITDRGNNGSQNAYKPTVGQSDSALKKKKGNSSRLSFGPGEIVSGDAAELLEGEETFVPKKSTLNRRVLASDSLRNSLTHQRGPFRTGDDEEERPTYSRDYLNELKSSTPSTPKNLQSRNSVAEDEPGLDASELDGATIVEMGEKFGSSAPNIPSEAEIREKKERRARLAKEEDFISLNDDDDAHGRQLSLQPRKKKEETRLVREDEDLGEGFEEFVEDGRISLGKKQEREAKRRQRKEIADLIHQAEGSSNEGSDDSEAERRAAYEAAQTRAGMDGLVKPQDTVEEAAAQIPSRITALPVLSECLERLQTTLTIMEQQLAQKRQKMADLEQEKRDIVAREAEVQELLKEAGARYSALKADTNLKTADPSTMIEAHNNGYVDRIIADRGLESFGNTPTARPEVDDGG